MCVCVCVCVCVCWLSLIYFVGFWRTKCDIIWTVLFVKLHKT